jgi:hypothetical protein
VERPLDAYLRLLNLNNAKGVAPMSDIKLRLPLLTRLVVFVDATYGAGELLRCQPAEHTRCRQSVQQ